MQYTFLTKNSFRMNKEVLKLLRKKKKRKKKTTEKWARDLACTSQESIQMANNMSEKVLNLTIHQRNANLNHNQIPLSPARMANSKTAKWGEDVEQLELLQIIGG